MIIGKCENILTVTFVVVGQPVGLALVFTAKAIARQREQREDAGYYLGGTMVNFTISLLVAMFGGQECGGSAITYAHPNPLWMLDLGRLRRAFLQQVLPTPNRASMNPEWSHGVGG